MRWSWRRRRDAGRIAPLALTRLGLAVGLGGVVALVSGVVWSWLEFTVLGAAALVLVVLALVWVWFPTTPTVALSVQPHRVEHGGRLATATLTIRAGALPLVGSGLELPYGSRPVLVPVPLLGPYAKRTSAIDLPARTRGVYDVGPVRHVRTDPVRLARRTTQLSGRDVVLVRPATVDVPVFAPGLSNDLEGSASSQLSMSDLAFHALREYRPGDDLRHVHWRSSARSARLQVRQYHTTRRGQVTVVLDARPRSYPTARDFELAVSVATSLALRAVRDDLDVLLRCGDRSLATRASELVLDAACSFSTQDGDHRALVAAAVASAYTVGLLVQVSGSGCPNVELRSAAASSGPSVARLYVRADTALRARAEDVRGERQLTVPDLRELAALLSGGLR